MGLTFNQRVQQIQSQVNSLLCAGIDPDMERLPAFLPRSAEGVYEFCREIIEHTHPYVCGYKFNSAFFEVLGGEGFRILHTLRQDIPGDSLAIYDVKRGDIGNTARQYAHAAFTGLEMDAVTVNPYMGEDAVTPFIQDPARGVFVLCFTSNPGSRDFQQLVLASGDPVYLRVAEKAVEWNSNENIGLVVGATKAANLAEIRTVAPDLPILAPGVGAQGGDLHKVLEAGRSESGYGLIIPISRSILYAGSGEDYAEKAGQKAAEYKQQINEALTYV